MKKLIYLMLLTAILIMFTGAGCSVREDDPAQEPAQEPISGTIYNLEDGRILVVGSLEDVNVPRSFWFEQGYRAVYFALDEDTVVELNDEQVDQNTIARGMKVDVYHAGFLAESYPEQGKALRVVITDPKATEAAFTDSGRFIGVLLDETIHIEIKISGVPEEMPSRLFRMTDQARAVFESLDLDPEEVIIFRYIEDDQSEGLIFDLTRIEN